MHHFWDDFLLKPCLNKIQRFLSKPVKFITIYDTKKLSYFVSNKDKLPPLFRSNLVYEVACPGCGKTYIGMTQRCLSVRLKMHATKLSSSAVGQHLSECERTCSILSYAIYKTSSHYSTIFLCLLTTLLLLKTLFSITTKYFTLLNLTTTPFLISWFSWSTAYQTQQTFPGTLDLVLNLVRVVKNYSVTTVHITLQLNFLLLVGSFLSTLNLNP